MITKTGRKSNLHRNQWWYSTQHRNIEFVFLYLFWIKTIFKRIFYLKQINVITGSPLGAEGPGQLTRCSSINPTLSGSLTCSNRDPKQGGDFVILCSLFCVLKRTHFRWKISFAVIAHNNEQHCWFLFRVTSWGIARYPQWVIYPHFGIGNHWPKLSKAAWAVLTREGRRDSSIVTKE